ncbi:hypothetical protein [Lentzea sp. E54]|uniref:hypothetical protein n=1 Tax=Lentzea xerophila TaxID=3435883 RepID=UPI003DA659F7
MKKLVKVLIGTIAVCGATAFLAPLASAAPVGPHGEPMICEGHGVCRFDLDQGFQVIPAPQVLHPSDLVQPERLQNPTPISSTEATWEQIGRWLTHLERAAANNEDPMLLDDFLRREAVLHTIEEALLFAF